MASGVLLLTLLTASYLSKCLDYSHSTLLRDTAGM